MKHLLALQEARPRSGCPGWGSLSTEVTASLREKGSIFILQNMCFVLFRCGNLKDTEDTWKEINILHNPMTQR